MKRIRDRKTGIRDLPYVLMFLAALAAASSLLLLTLPSTVPAVTDPSLALLLLPVLLSLVAVTLQIWSWRSIQSHERRIVLMSYTLPDQKKARDLYHRLRKAGLKPWMDIMEVQRGENYFSALRDALASASDVLLVLSNSAVTKQGDLQRDLKLVLDFAEEAKSTGLRVVAARVEPVELSRLPDEVKAYTVIDLFNDDGFRRLEELLSDKDLAHSAGKA